MSRDRILVVALRLFVALLAAAFLTAAATRRLNFDESLALRAGWLEVAGEPAEPSFLMPWTLALGALAHVIADPRALFVTGRAIVCLLLAAALLVAVRAARLAPAAAAAALGLLLLQPAFVTHGYELRYDTALLLGLLAAYAAWLRRSPVALGLAIAWTGVHHLKGAALALGVLLAVTLEWRRERAALLRVWSTATGAAALWAVALALGGRLGRGLDVYRTFLALGADGGARTAPWEALAEPLRRAAPWWLLVAALLALSLLRREGRRQPSPGPAAFLALLTIGLLFLHPHPWPYMLALPAPFLAFLASGALAPRGATAVKTAAVVVAATLVAWLLVPGVPGPASPYRSALAAPMTRQVESLRALRSASRSGDRVIDPSGLAWFLPPCEPQWYLDSLFQVRARAGQWLTHDPRSRTPECRWAVATYRLAGLPPPYRDWFAREFHLLPGGIAVRGLEADSPRLADWPALPWRELESYWW